MILRKFLTGGYDGTAQKLAGDASTRSYFRVREAEEQFVICKYNDASQNLNSFLKIVKILEENGIRVPRLIDEITDSGVVLQEDLGQESLHSSFAVLDSDDFFSYYEKAIDIIIKMQKIDQKKYKSSDFSSLSFDSEKLMYEVNFCCTYFIEKYLGQGAKKNQLKVVTDCYFKVAAYLEKHCNVFVHRDYHSKNLMIKEQELVVIDFQDARMGTIAYDLVSLLEDSYIPIPEQLKNKLYNCFESKAVIPYSKDEFSYLYRMTAIQRIFKAIGSFSYVFELKKDPKYLRYIDRSFSRLLVLLDEINESNTNSLKKSLKEIYYVG